MRGSLYPFFRPKWGTYTDMERRVHLPIGVDNEEKIEIGARTLHYFTDIEYRHIRESTTKSTV